MDPLVAQVVIQRPLPGPLSYLIPDGLRNVVTVGCAVEVPFRSGTADGFVVDIISASDPSLKGLELKQISDAPADFQVFTEQDLDFFQWIANYYQLPLGEVFHSAFPKAVLKRPKRKKKTKESYASESAQAVATTAASTSQSAATVAPFEFTTDQAAAFEKIQRAFTARAFKSFLLFGVTGSGKTEIYIRAAQNALTQGRSTLILVPEIALTPQLRSRFEDRFGSEVAVLHSSLGEKSRREYWWDILKGRRRVVVGARSALFAPLSDIGLIVVDEEHEPSYKQEDRLRYSARDLALVRARQHNAIAILGSATPAIETYHAAENGKHERLELRTRPQSRPMPSIETVDLTKEPREQRSPEMTNRALIGARMREALAAVLSRQEQAMVFVNRKGFANFLICRDCGEVPKCLNCSVSLTYYQRSKKLRCHYCGLEMAAIDQCPKCLSFELKFMGMGTELIEDELNRLYPGTKIARLDAETADTAKKIEETLEKFRRGETQILVGTQMLAKGHDFPNVTFVGVVLADLNLHLPDFRAGERTFQLLTQVSGRAGRADKPGHVIIQTLMPDHYVLQAAAKQDYVGFLSR